MTIPDARLIAAQEALRVGVWTLEERDGMSAAFEEAQRKHGYYESLFAVAAFILRHRAKSLTAPVEAAPPYDRQRAFDEANAAQAGDSLKRMAQAAQPVGAMGEDAAQWVKTLRYGLSSLSTKDRDDLSAFIESLAAENARLTEANHTLEAEAQGYADNCDELTARIRELEAAQPPAPMSDGPKMVRNARGDLVPDIPPICGCRKECLRPYDCAHDKEIGDV